jgi:hypothetical protein
MHGRGHLRRSGIRNLAHPLHVVAVRLGHENDLMRSVTHRVIRQQVADDMHVLAREILMNEEEVHVSLNALS